MAHTCKSLFEYNGGTADLMEFSGNSINTATFVYYYLRAFKCIYYILLSTTLSTYITILIQNSEQAYDVIWA